MPLFSHDCKVNNKPEELCITWLKPEGGNETDFYLIQWVVEGKMIYFDSILYSSGMESINYTIKNLQPAQAVVVSIRANNTAGEGKAATKMYATGRFFF